MAVAAFCTVCQRTVYIEEDSTPVCPVCSSPVLEAPRVELDPDQPEETTERDEERDSEDDDQPSGAK
jgi:DNA-directed RNA polymerase subunit RPC12/RpoP